MAKKLFEGTENNTPQDNRRIALGYAGILGSEFITWAQAKIQLLANLVSINLSPQATPPTYSEGTVYYDDIKKALTYFNDSSEIAVNIGQEVLFIVENQTGTLLTNGTVISPDETTVITPADAYYKNKSRIIAVLTEDIADGETGYATKLGQVGGLDTSMFSPGQVVYLGSDGEIVADTPTDGGYICIVGVVDISSATEGIITVDTSVSDTTVEVTDTNGFPPDQRENTIIVPLEGSRQMSLVPDGVADFHYYELGNKYESTGDSVIWSDDEGEHWFFYEDGIFVTEYNPNLERRKHIILNHAFISSIYWNVTDQKIEIDVVDERHGIGMSPATHLQQHLSQGAFWEYGYQLGDITLGNGNSDADAQFSVTAGAFYDEDIEHLYNGDAVGFTGIVCYNEGANGYLRTDTQTNFAVLNAAAGRLYFNEFTGGAWQLTEVTNGDFVLYHDFGFNGQTETFISVMGQAEYSTAANARSGAATEIGNIIAQLPFPEMIPIGTRIYQTRDTYSNSVKARIIADADGNTYVNWTQSELSGGGSSPSSHLNLTDVQQAGTGVTQGHVSDQAQTFIGAKTFKGNTTIGVNNEGNINEEYYLFLKSQGNATNKGYSASFIATIGDGVQPSNSGLSIGLFHWNGASYVYREVFKLINDGRVILPITPVTDSGTNDILTYNSSTGAIEKRNNAYTALIAGAAVSFSLATGLNKTLNVAVSSTITFSNFVSGMQGDIRLNVTSVSTITLAASGVTFYGVGNLADLPIGIYHIAYTVISATVIDYNINTTPYA